MIAPSVPEYVLQVNSSDEVSDDLTIRLVEEEIESAIESRNEALQTIRELGPPDLVHLVKQAKSGGRQVSNWHHVFVHTYLLIPDVVWSLSPRHRG